MTPVHVLQANNNYHYETARDAQEMLTDPRVKFLHLEWPTHTWPGCYEMHYITADGGRLCHQCANEHLMRTIADPDDQQWHIVAADINYESPDLHCDHCGRIIDPEYGD